LIIVLLGLTPARLWGRPPPAPTAGFTALFNGRDLTGWLGMPHFDPYKAARQSRWS
jgi:hypothetical protein